MNQVTQMSKLGPSIEKKGENTVMKYLKGKSSKIYLKGNVKTELFEIRDEKHNKININI